MAEVIKLLEPGTAECDAAKYALKVLTFDLVAARVVRVGARTWWKVLGVLLVVMGVVSIFGEYVGDLVETVGAQSLNAVLLLLASYVMLAVGGFLFLFTRRRERFVAHALDHKEFFAGTVFLASPPLQSEKRRKFHKRLLGNKKARAQRRPESNEGPVACRPGQCSFRSAPHPETL